ncbi:restriction endonuclease subunit S [Stutzerimonas decontaminans]|uniref:Restriction endonuclease subunit S n=1 Tax=Stutzerimonas decontaminans TaxID=3022791 RepID=A0ABX4W249_9GAMM|nr:restriction endonuclease subunit S [Stutzerimonas decontaminans]MCQ4246067.1 restriction endonuclease subunit S [Stutzerimonas decontaminans]PNF86537.1 restriction endonuclease subunit S [Stutzerimonas decontaminans]
MLRADCFPERWDVVPLGDAVTFLDNMRRPVTASDRVAGPYPYYGANGIQGTIDGFIFDEPLLLLAEDGGNFSNPDRDIAYIAEGRYWVNNHAHVLRPKASLDLRFLYRVLQRYDVTPFIKGATRAKLTKGDASLIPIPLPPLPEQKRIAAILDKADAIRRKRQQAIQLADDFLRAVFLDMFGDPVTNPKGWEITSLTSCGSFKNGLNFEKGEAGNSLRYLGVGDFKSLSTIVDILSLGSVELNKLPAKDYLLEDGDLVFVRSNGNKALVGRCITVYPGDEPLTFSGFCIRYRAEGENVEPEYLNYLFRTPSMKQVMLSGGQGANIQNINQGILSSLKIPLPPAELQRGFSKIVAAYRQSMLRFDSSIANVENMFEAISQKAFSGQL